jgi:hypothetical protein
LQATAQTPMDRRYPDRKRLGRLGWRHPLGPHPVGRLAPPSGRRARAARRRRLSGVRPVALPAESVPASSRGSGASGYSSKRRAISLRSRRLGWPARAENCRAVAGRAWQSAWSSRSTTAPTAAARSPAGSPFAHGIGGQGVVPVPFEYIGWCAVGQGGKARATDSPRKSWLRKSRAERPCCQQVRLTVW